MFLTSLSNRVNKPSSQDAYVYAMAKVAKFKLRLKDFEGAHKGLERCQKILDSFDTVETVVNAAFYEVNADYYYVGAFLSFLSLSIILRLYSGTNLSRVYFVLFLVLHIDTRTYA